MSFENNNMTIKKHTILGIISFCCAVIFIILWMVALSLISIFYPHKVSSSIMGFLALMLYMTCFLLFLSFVLGILAVREKNALKVFPIMAILISLFGVITTIVLQIVGTMMP